MSNKAQKAIVNCGTTQVSVSVFSGEGSELVLEKLIVENLIYNYAAEGEWEHAATAALRSILSTHKLKCDFTVIAPGHLLLTKSAKVTQVEREKQAQIIEFEAQNSFPFPLSELVWGSQVIASDGVEAEVILYALKRENAERFAQAMMRAGIKPEAIRPATYLDYQAYRYATQDRPENALIVNIGAHTTNLTFVNSNGFSVQNISVGGNLLTQKIADAIGKPFQAAEQLKIAYFSGTTQVPDDDPLAGTLRACAEDFTRRLNQDITRRIINIKRQDKDAVPVKILLSGRGATLPNLAKTLETLQHVPVEFMTPEATLKLAQGITPEFVESHRPELSEAIGEAASLVYSGLESVNLLPKQIADELEFSKKRPFIVAAMILLAIAPWPFHQDFLATGATLKEQKDVATAQIALLSERQKKIETAQKEAVNVVKTVKTLENIEAELFQWNDFLAELQNCVAQLQAPTGKDEDDENIFGEDRHVWVESVQPSYIVKTVPATEDVPAKTEFKTEVKITFGMLMRNVDANAPEHNDSEFKKRVHELLTAIKKAPFIDTTMPVEDKADFTQYNLPLFTVTFVLKSKGI